LRTLEERAEVPGPIATDEADAVGREIHALMTRLYPICRSLTGDGVRRTLGQIRGLIPLEIHEVPTGTRVFDWTVPKEWNIRDGYVADATGRRVIDFRESNLHVVSYSSPVRARMSLAELRGHLHTIPEHPDWIPHRATYYREGWGFCLSHRRLQELEEGEYEVCIDSTLEDGHLTYGECFLPGATADEVLVSCHTCHPSLCNDNLSGIGVATYLARELLRRPLRLSYRFVFIPATIGSITWLSRNEERLAAIKHGLVLTCLGDPGHPTYKRSRRGNAEIDRAFAHVLEHSGRPHELVDFYPFGYDERQYCSPGFDLPVGVLSRTRHGRFPEYHTSADDLDFVGAAYLGDSLARCLEAFAVLEGNRTYVNMNPRCEPQLGRRGLYRVTGGPDELALLWVLNLSDGLHSLLDIAERSGIAFRDLKAAAEALEGHGLLEAIPDGSESPPSNSHRSPR
jgi:aminopeptidase-like protein